MRILLTTLEGLEEVAALEARMLGLREVEVKGRSLLVAEGSLSEALRMRTVDSVSEVLCERRLGGTSLRDLRLAVRECLRCLKGAVEGGEVRVRAWVRGRGVGRRALELVAAREAVRVLGVRASPRARRVLRVYLLEGGTLLLALQANEGPLHLRSYYVYRHPQALNPLIAAAIPLIAPASSVYDPCCGSGTIPIEYALARPQAEVACSDVVREHVRGALTNAGRAGVTLDAFVADLFHSPLAGWVELVAANPARGFGEAYAHIRAVVRLAAERASRLCLVTPYKMVAQREAEEAGFRLAKWVPTYQGGRRVSLLLFERASG